MCLNPNLNIAGTCEMKMISLKTSFVVALFAAALPAHANLITNGSFEQYTGPALTSGQWTILYGTNVTGWNTSTGCNNPNCGIELRNNVAGAASDGNIYAELDTNYNSFASQLLTTTGALYLLTFDYSPRMNVGTGSNGIQVWWNGTLAGTYTGSGSTTGNNWVSQSLYLVGGNPSTTLEFRAVGSSDSYGGSLDNVSVTVPEPGTLALLGLGLAGLGFAKRKKANA